MDPKNKYRIQVAVIYLHVTKHCHISSGKCFQLFCVISEHRSSFYACSSAGLLCDRQNLMAMVMCTHFFIPVVCSMHGISCIPPNISSLFVFPSLLFLLLPIPCTLYKVRTSSGLLNK